MKNLFVSNFKVDTVWVIGKAYFRLDEDKMGEGNWKLWIHNGEKTVDVATFWFRSDAIVSLEHLASTILLAQTGKWTEPHLVDLSQFEIKRKDF